MEIKNVFRNSFAMWAAVPARVQERLRMQAMDGQFLSSLARKKGDRMTNQQLGALGEKTAAEYLVQKGYRILCRNFRCREGEIDIVALKEDTLHFVEVKTRQGLLFGHPLESVTNKKAAHMRAAASRFLSQWPREWERPRHIRMDAIAIEIDHVANI